MVKCKNCGKIVIYKYCPHCGQRVERRLTFRTMIEDMLRGITNGDRGVFFTLKELWTRPGHMIAEYIDGKRVNHFRPFPLLILLTGLVALFDKWIDSIHETKKIVEAVSNGNNLDITPLKATIMVPFFAIASWLLFYRRRKYNYIEHLYITAFATIQRQVIFFILLSIPAALMSVAQFDKIEIILYLFVIIAAFGVTMWDYKQIFNLQTKRAFWKTVLLFAISGLAFLTVSAIIIFVIYLFGEVGDLNFNV